MNLNWDLALGCAAAAGTALIAWRKLGTATREELKLRARCAGGTLLGNPVAYRVLVLKSGNGPGIAVNGGPSLVSQCTVVGVRGDGFSMSWPESAPGVAVDEEGGEDWDSDDEQEEDVTGEGSPAPNVVPAVCREGHVSYPATFVRVHDTSVYTAMTPTRTGNCPQCGKPRAILPGAYRAGADGLVTRAEPPGEGD